MGIQNTEVPDKIKPSYVKEDAIELTQVTPITQADAEVVVTADAEVVTEAKVIEAPEAPKSRTEHVGEGNDASLTLGQRVSAHGAVRCHHVHRRAELHAVHERSDVHWDQARQTRRVWQWHRQRCALLRVRSILLCFRHSACSETSGVKPADAL